MANDAPQSGPVPVPLPGGALPPPAPPRPPVLYPDSDGKPMSDNTKQARWIVVLYGNLSALYRDRPDVFFAADLLWYAVEGQPGERTAPDVLVAFGRPKGDRGSYKQLEEGGTPVHVAFEVRSPNNTDEELADKQAFYEAHGVEEYYLYDPDTNRLSVFLRRGTALRREHKVDGFVSPRLGIRFEPSAQPEMAVYYPDGRRFLLFEELVALQQQTERERDDEKKRADDEKKRADQLQERADDAEKRLADVTKRADDAQKRAAALARLAELNRKARRGQATPDELAELERLEEQAGA